MCKKFNKPIINMAATAANLKSFRIRSGYSVRELQGIFNFSTPQAIYNWEAGRDVPVIDNLIVLASVYGVTINDLVVTDLVEIECEMPEAKKSA